MPRSESFHHRRSFGAAAVPSPIRSFGTSGAWQGCRRQAVALTGGCVAQCSPSAESMSVAEHARDFLRRSLCAAYGAEFFLYEKMGRRAIVPAGSISEAGAEIPHPITPQKTGIQGESLPDAPLAAHLRIRRSRIPRCVVKRRTAETRDSVSWPCPPTG